MICRAAMLRCAVVLATTTWPPVHRARSASGPTKAELSIECVDVSADGLSPPPVEPEPPTPVQPSQQTAERVGPGSGASILTPREREVAVLIAQGASNPEIGAALVVSRRTVEAHVTAILGKLALTSRAQIAVWAVQHGLGPTDQDT